ncbi:MAG: DUF1080 domain-containing protein, partial [Planctomycetes bacterium]|nr:DUF1080 domain-containing protein [Planctomycetota bacterium]
MSVMASDPLVGKCLGGVEIIEPIGQGGMGTVYKGRQTALDRVVAIKTLPAHLAANAAFVERFHREARNAARLRHPNIVEVYAVGEAEGVHYLAMEYVDGEGLDKVLAREGPLDAPRAAAILKQACGALAAAHEAGIVHRDIKPSNLLLDSHGSVRVTDFGLAKRADDASVTQTSDVLGTPLYLAPEAATGAEPCPQSDLYSLGATFYHLLAGRPPFEGKTSGELIVKHVTGEPMPLHEAAPGVDPRLARIIDRLLAKPLAERYGSAEALLRDLEALGPLRSRAQLAASEGRALIAGAPTAAMTQGRRLARQALAERLAGGQRRTRKRHIALAAGAAIVALVLALVVALPRGRRAGQALLPDVEQQNIEAREHNARVLLRSAQAAAKAKDWDEVKAQLDSLEKDCGNTQLFVANRAAIEALRKQAEAPPKEQTRPATKTEVAPPPKQKPPEELAAEGGMAKGLVAAFYAGQNFERFITAKAVPNIGFNWGPEAPMPGVPADRFSARFVGWLKVPDAGDYTFRFWRDDGARLYLDGKLVIAEWEACNKGEPATVHLDKGMHRLWVEYMEIVGMAALALHWSRGGEERVIAADAFCCETELLARMKEKPAEDPLAGLRPDGARDAHGPEVAEAGKFFHGRLRRLPEDRVELFYDWADAEQLRDWAPVGPTALAVTDGELRFGGGGSRGAAHSASFAGDVEVEGTWCVRERLGGEASCIPSLCCSPGRCYSLVLKVANQKIYKDRGTQVIGWGKAGCPDGEPHTFRFAREGASLKTWINGALQTNITDPDYTSGSVMLGSWNAQVGYKGVRIVGKLDTAWLAAHPDAAKRVAAAPLEQPKAPAPEGPGQWVSLFDGKTLDGWKVVADRGYAKHGRVEAQNGELLLGTGAPVTGIAWTRDLPSLDYEVAFEVMCLAGGNNWCNFTFPVGASGCSFCFLGIGDGLTGLDQVEGAPVTRNVTTKKMAFERNRWYRVKLRVTRAAVQAWVDDAEVVTLQLRDHAVNVYDDYWGPLRPLGVANWESTTALRNLRLRRLQAEELPAVAGADLGPMVAKATEPFDAVFHTDAPWDIEGDTWYGEKEFVDGHAYHNGWLVLRDRRLGDFVLDADVTDLGDEVGFRYGIIFRRVYDWQLMLSLTRQYKGLDLRSISEYRPQPSGAVPGVTIRAGPKRFEPQEGKPYHLRIECVGTRVRCLVDGGLVGEAEDRTLLSGEIVLYVHRAKARFANIRIRPAPEAPAEKPEEAGPLWWERAERMSADARLSARAKLQAWEDVLQRFPKAPAATLARAREQRDRWAK